MNRSIAVLVATLATVGANHAFAQEDERAKLEFTLIPGGSLFFTEKDAEPDFYNYTVGGSVTYNLTRIFSIEGEVGGNLGISQDLEFGGLTDEESTPNIMNYTGNLVLSIPTGGSAAPYATGGAGGLTMFESEELGVNDTETFFVGNVGGGAKWLASSGRWGLRGDYRFLAVRDKDDASAFFGGERRYGHRVYGGVVITALR